MKALRLTDKDGGREVALLPTQISMIRSYPGDSVKGTSDTTIVHTTAWMVEVTEPYAQVVENWNAELENWHA